MKRILLAFIVLSLFVRTFGQENPINTYFQPSPNASNLGLFGKIPVSNYTGTINIPIALHNVTEGNINVPINLNYTGRGVRPNQPTGWVGLNWTLDCGGVITREIKMKPDETPQAFFDRGEEIKDLCDAGLADEIRFFYDTEPDIFYFNFGGYSGKFFWGNDDQFHFEPHQNFAIELNDGDYSYGKIEVIKITDDKGVEYTFGQYYAYEDRESNAVEFSKPLNDPSLLGYCPPVAWYLKKIKSGKDEIEFNYKMADDNGDLFVQYTANKYFSSSNTAVYAGIDNGFFQRGYSFSLTGGISSGYQKSITYKRYLESIVTKNQIVEFYTEDAAFKLTVPGQTDICDVSHNCQPQKLSKIIVKNKETGLQVKSFNFNYNDRADQMLRLDEVLKCDNDDNTILPYQFTYKNFDALPNAVTDRVDFWGYFNNKAGDVPSIDLATNTSSDVCDPNPDVCDAGLLEYIYYPTGGYTNLKYEIHNCRYVVDREEVWENAYGEIFGGMFIRDEGYTNAGGVRIKRVIDFDGKDTTQGRTFIYSNGVLYQAPVWYVDLSGTGTMRFNGCVTDLSADIGIQEKKSSSIMPLPESYVGYTNVRVEHDAGFSEEYTYTNFTGTKDDIPVDNLFNGILSYYFPISSRAFERGKLILEKYMDNTNHPVKEITHIYNSDFSDLNYRKNHGVLAFKYYHPFPGTSNAFFTDYHLYYYPMYLQNKVEKIYNQPYDGTYIENSISYSYNDKILLNETTTTQSNGDVITSELYYSGEDDPDNSGTNLGIPEMYSVHDPNYKNIISPVIKTKKKVNDNVVSMSSTEYIYDNVNDLVLLSKTITKPTGTNEEVITKLSYDNNGKVVQSQIVNESSIGIGNPTAIFWAYNNTYPIAKAENVTYTQLASAIESATMSHIGYTGDVLDDYLKIVSDFSFVDNYDKDSWDDFVQSVQDALPSDALVNLYTYEPLVGMTSQTDPNGKTTYYEYDSFGRLYRVRDYEGTIIKQYKYNYANK